MSSVVARLGDASSAGTWSIYARAAGGKVVNIASLRGAPVWPSSFSFSDPFGPKQLELSLPQVTFFDRLGVGDLSWLRKKAALDLVYVPDVPLPAAYPFGSLLGASEFAWEGDIIDFGFDGNGLQVTCKGAMLGLDGYLAKPEYWAQPRPYEYAIARQFSTDARPHLRTTSLRVQWPSWWDLTYTPPAKGTPHYLVPRGGMRRGDKWTGLLTRSSGSWEPALSSYVQTMLASMYTRRGRWTLDLASGRVPVLLHRDMLTAPDDSCAVLDLTSPTVRIGNLTVDWSQSLDVVYAQGTSLAGVAFSGMQVSADGQRTSYVPLAARRQAWPASDNEWRDLSILPTETLLQTLPGLSEFDAQKIAMAHLERFGDPGITGSVTVSGDVKLADGSVIPHFLLRAGMTVVLENLFGLPDGVLCHVTDSNTNFLEAGTELTLDSKYRDALTLEEVRTRGRDAMAISRMLVAGNYNPPIPDMLSPWSYAEGAGIIPAPPTPGLGVFDGMADDVLFPWTQQTTARPPKNARWREHYIRIGPAKANADKNWSGRPRAAGGMAFGIPVRVAQAGSIRLIQVAAYDRNGNVLKVPFHLSLYYISGVNVQSMPKIPAYQPNPTLASYYPYHHPPFAVAQHYPYVVTAWETYNPNGTVKNTEVPIAVQTAGLIRAWGSDKVKAGYFPGDGYSGSPTGLLVDETSWQFDTSQAPGFNPYTRKQRPDIIDGPGWIFVMIYCDAQQSQEVFFLGRMWRAEPGSQGGEG